MSVDIPKSNRRDQAAELVLTITGPPGVPAEEVIEQTRAMVVLIDRAYRAFGGSGIQILDASVVEIEIAVDGEDLDTKEL